MTPTEALQEAINRVGAKAELCRLITAGMPGREKPVVGANLYGWLKNGTPADYCPVIEKITGVRCEDLRPGTDWSARQQRHNFRGGGTRRELNPTQGSVS